MRWIFPARLPDHRDFSRPIHDGDSLYLELDKGHRQHLLADIRLLNVRAPELGEPGGAEAHDWVLDWFANRDLGQPWPFWVETFKTSGGADKKTLDRYLGVVYDYDPRSFVNTNDSLNSELAAWLKTHPEWGPGRLVGDS